MGSESISSLILFIAAMLVAAGVAGTLVTNVNQISGSIDTYSGDVRDRLDTDVEIISDPGSDGIFDDGDGTDEYGNLTLYVKNTGDRTLPDDGTGLDVLVDGQYVPRSDLTVTVLGDPVWRGGAVAEVVIDLEGVGGAGIDPDDPDEHRIVLAVHGDEEVFEFYGP